MKRKSYDTYGSQQFGHRDEYLAAVQHDGAQFAGDVGFYQDTCDANGENCLVTELNDETFWSFPQDHQEDVFLLEFYTPWCTHCQEHAADVKNVALRLEGTVKFAAVNCETYKPLCQRFSVKYYPTLNLFLSKENQEIRWPKDNALHADALHSWIVSRFLIYQAPACSTDPLTILTDGAGEAVDARAERPNADPCRLQQGGHGVRRPLGHQPVSGTALRCVRRDEEDDQGDRESK